MISLKGKVIKYSSMQMRHRYLRQEHPLLGLKVIIFARETSYTEFVSIFRISMYDLGQMI